MPTLEKKESNLSVPSERLPEFLGSLGLDPYQITTALYGLYREIRMKGRLTPSEDNAFHLNKQTLLNMAKSPALAAELYTVISKVSKTKSWDPLFKKEEELPAEAPFTRHNSIGNGPVIKKTSEIKDDIEILDFGRFLLNCGINPMLIKKAFEEKALLRGGKS